MCQSGAALCTSYWLGLHKVELSTALQRTMHHAQLRESSAFSLVAVEKRLVALIFLASNGSRTSVD